MKLRVIAFFLCVLVPAIYGGDFKPEQYQEVLPLELKAFPENYKNKDICYKTVYRGFRTNLPYYIERSGFKEGKYYNLFINPTEVPVLGKIKGFLDERILDLQNGTPVKVYGKIKKFTFQPVSNMSLPRYYLDLDEIVKIEKKKEENTDKDADKTDSKTGKSGENKGASIGEQDKKTSQDSATKKTSPDSAPKKGATTP